VSDDDDDVAAPDPPGARNHMTPDGYARLRSEWHALMKVERPKVVEIVSWAAGNGDRSENGDYLYGKKRLREIDKRARFLTRRLENAEVVDPSLQTRRDRVFFGATVTYVCADDSERTVTIVGADEAETARGEISLHAPVARALLGARVGDAVRLHTPNGIDEIEVLAIRYPEPYAGR
jgi:transcription elongation factor GreB